MANEVTTTSADDLTLAAGLLEQHIIDALYENNHGVVATRRADISGLPTKALDFPKTPKLSASSLTEGTDMAYTPFTTTKATITVGEVGITVTPTDLLSVSDIVGNVYYQMEAAKAVLNKLTVDIVSLSTGFSNTAGPSTGNPLLESHVQDAIGTLEAASVPGPYVAIIGTTQKKNLVADIGTTISAAATTGRSPREELNDIGAARPDGALGELYGFPWFSTAAVPTINNGADVSGMLVSAHRALGYLTKWGVRVELQRDATLRATEIVVVAAYGVGEIDDTSGVAIHSDA